MIIPEIIGKQIIKKKVEVLIEIEMQKYYLIQEMIRQAIIQYYRIKD